MKTDLENALQAIITDGWANATVGSVDSPRGHWAIIDMTTERTMLAEVADLENADILPNAWVTVCEHEDGSVDYEEHATERRARMFFDAICHDINNSTARMSGN